MDIESTALFERVQYTEPLNVNNNSDAMAFCIDKTRDNNLNVYNKAKVTCYTKSPLYNLSQWKCFLRRIIMVAGLGYWCLTSLNIAEMISDNGRRV